MNHEHPQPLSCSAIKDELRAMLPDKLPHDWPDEADFRDDLGLDSLDLVELVARLEQATGVHVPDADLGQLSSAAASATYLGRRRAAAFGTLYGSARELTEGPAVDAALACP